MDPMGIPYFSLLNCVNHLGNKLFPFWRSNSKNHCRSFWAKRMRIPPPLKNQPTPKRNSGFSKGLTSPHGVAFHPPRRFLGSQALRQTRIIRDSGDLGAILNLLPLDPNNPRKTWRFHTPNIWVITPNIWVITPKNEGCGFPWCRLLFTKII